MLSPLISLCRALRRLPQFGVFIAFASVLFAQAALADGTGKGNGNPPPDPKTWTGFGWGLGIAADFDLGGKRVTGAQIDTANIVRVTIRPAMSVLAYITSRLSGRLGRFGAKIPT